MSTSKSTKSSGAATPSTLSNAPKPSNQSNQSSQSSPIITNITKTKKDDENKEENKQQNEQQNQEDEIREIIQAIHHGTEIAEQKQDPSYAPLGLVSKLESYWAAQRDELLKREAKEVKESSTARSLLGVAAAIGLLATVLPALAITQHMSKHHPGQMKHLETGVILGGLFTIGMFFLCICYPALKKSTPKRKFMAVVGGVVSTILLLIAIMAYSGYNIHATTTMSILIGLCVFAGIAIILKHKYFPSESASLEEQLCQMHEIQSTARNNTLASIKKDFDNIQALQNPEGKNPNILNRICHSIIPSFKRKKVSDLDTNVKDENNDENENTNSMRNNYTTD